LDFFLRIQNIKGKRTKKKEEEEGVLKNNERIYIYIRLILLFKMNYTQKKKEREQMT
jgi:hypothetical protein